jgi:hypothetical protein
METYTQYYQFIDLPKCNGNEMTPLSMNCTDCHAVAKPLGAPTVDGGPYPESSYQIFSFMLNNADSSCPADFNYDLVVDGIDLAMLIGAWGSTESKFDLSGTGVVDGGDLAELLSDWGSCPQTGVGSRRGLRVDPDAKQDGAAVRRYLDALERE